ncbi:hypothetical protein KKA53_03220 [Candidatus Dependentiae bacterium]|nr:hypothetical protein [Candidatus Dependentiae bacterium]
MTNKTLLFFIVTGAPLTLFCEKTIEQDPIKSEQILEGENIINEQNLNEQDLDDIFNQVANNVITELLPQTEEEIVLSALEKFKLFWDLPLSIKWELSKEHIKTHQIAYGTSASGAALAAAYLLYYKKRKQKQNE